MPEHRVHVEVPREPPQPADAVREVLTAHRERPRQDQSGDYQPVCQTISGQLIPASLTSEESDRAVIGNNGTYISVIISSLLNFHR